MKHNQPTNQPKKQTNKWLIIYIKTYIIRYYLLPISSALKICDL